MVRLPEPQRGWIERFAYWVFQSWWGGFVYGVLAGIVAGVTL